nr:Deferrochelatase/peroxidase EfeB precursor [Klebsiella pneumoniae]
MGLLFVCYQHDLEKGFLTVQKRLNGEALEEYVKPIGGGYFFVLPGVVDENTIWESRCCRPDTNPARKGRAFSAVFSFSYISCHVLYFCNTNDR